MTQQESGKETPIKGSVKTGGKRGRPKKNKDSLMNSPNNPMNKSKRIKKNKPKRGRKKNLTKVNSKENDGDVSLNYEGTKFIPFN